MTTRRSFMAGILAAATPPGFVRAGVLMPVAPLIVRPLDLFSVLGGPPYMGDGGAKAALQEMAEVQMDYMRRLDIERLAIDQLSSFMARHTASILDQYLTGSYKPGFR